MSEAENNTDNQPTTPVVDLVSLPPQQSPQDTSNWEDKPMNAPDGRVHINGHEPSQTAPSQPVVQTPRPTSQQSGHIRK